MNKWMIYPLEALLHNIFFFFSLGNSQKDENKFSVEIENLQVAAVGKDAYNGKQLQWKNKSSKKVEGN